MSHRSEPQASMFGRFSESAHAPSLGPAMREDCGAELASTPEAGVPNGTTMDAAIDKGRQEGSSTAATS